MASTGRRHLITTLKKATKTMTTDHPYVIIRTQSAGVHAGHLISRDGGTVNLRDARRIYQWQIDHARHGTHQVTCSELAVYGPHGDSRLAVTVARVTLLGVIEIIQCTADAQAAIMGWPS